MCGEPEIQRFVGRRRIPKRRKMFRLHLQRFAQCRQHQIVDALLPVGLGLRVRQQIAQCSIDAALFRWHNARNLDRVAHGEDLGAQASIVKLFWAEASQRLYETACSVLGGRALLADDEWVRGLLTTRANSIMGGTSEIQRTIIGERILGLPREQER